MRTTGRFTLGGKESIPPIEAVQNVGESGIFVNAAFNGDNVQPAITPMDFTFVNEAAQQIRQHVSDGLIFQGLDFSMEVIGESGTIEVLDGYLDLTDGYQELNAITVKVKAKLKESTLTLEQKAGSLTVDLLKQTGALTDSDLVDVEYLVERPVNAVEEVVTSIAIFLMVKELVESVEKIASDTATVLGLTSTSVTGTVGATVYQIAILVVRAAYATIMLRTIVIMIIELLKQFISPVRTIKGFTLRKIFEVGFLNLGYTFESPLTELDNYTYISSIKTKSDISTDNNQNGVPSANDYGYNFGELVKLGRDYFDAEIAIVDNVVQFRSSKDPYWLKESTYKMEDVLLDEDNPKGHNTDEMVKSRIIQFQIDDSDWWTLDNYKGTSYSIITQHMDDVDSNVDSLVGYEKTIFNVSLSHVKENLNALEEILLVLAKSADAITSAFGGKQNFTDKIERRVGMVKISHENTSNPKLVYLVGGSIPSNHRDNLSARYSWENYLNNRSFVDNNFQRQRIFYTGVSFGFGLSGFQKLILNSYFYTNNGRKGKFTNIKWDYESDEVIADFWIQHTYADKLKELKAEQDG